MRLEIQMVQVLYHLEECVSLYHTGDVNWSPDLVDIGAAVEVWERSKGQW